MSYNEQYRTDPLPAFVGMVADMSNAVIVSRTAEAKTPFGVAVARGTDDNTVRPVTIGDSEVFGISIRSQATAAESVNEYPINDNVAVMRKGPIWVKVGATVAVGDPVKVVVATGVFGTASGVAIDGASYESAAVSGELAKVHII